MRGDKEVGYTDVVKVMGYIRGAGFKANVIVRSRD